MRIRRVLRVMLISLLAVATVALVIGWTTTGGFASLGDRARGDRLDRMKRSALFKDGRFENPVPTTVMVGGSTWSTTLEFLFGGEERVPPAPLPVLDPKPAWTEGPKSGLRVTWLGHSSLLLEVDGARVLTDPVFGDRASPSTLIGPKRFHPTPVTLAELPKLDAVVISHDHYDHLDYPTISELKSRGVPFYVPLGVGAHLEKWGVPAEQILEHEWWQEANVPGTSITLATTPARHFSGRTGQDNATLWASWVIRSPKHRVYFSGDTGLTPQFEEIRVKHGPFDLVMLEVGAYHPNWGQIHLGPEQAVEAHRMLGGGPLLPIHWGTFNLGLHAWNEPAETLTRLAADRGIPLLTPKLGQPIEPVPTSPPATWWREVAKR